MQPLESVPFDDLFVRSLPGDASKLPGVREVRGAAYSLVDPTPVRQPRLIAWSREAGELLGVERPPDGEVLGGNRVLATMKPYSACYGGHQFGTWARQLGDGRAITLGEIVNPRQERWEVQLKGAGPTPYSRHADGRAVMRSSVREFLCSEAMFHLGVPTTRALSLVATGEGVLRDMFYDGNPAVEPGAVVTRLSPSFLRFGNYEIFARRREDEMLAKLVDYTLQQLFPGRDLLGFFEEVCRTTALLMAEWMRVGFVHGVMNTDNLSILGLTIDYGPYGWLDAFEPHFTPNTTDRGLRYCYIQQPQVALWNLARLAEALYPLVGAIEPLQERLEVYQRTYNQRYPEVMLAKLGLSREPEGLLEELLQILVSVETDMSIFFRKLADVADEEAAPLDEAYYDRRQLSRHYLERRGDWLRRYLACRELEPPGHRERMNAVNPRVIPRNYLVQEVIDKVEAGDSGAVEAMLEGLRHPYADGDERLGARRPDWARSKPGCSALSCSS